MQKRVEPVRLAWKPDKKLNMPVYEQIVRFICQKVRSGEWPAGTRLPSQRDMAVCFGVNRSTVSAAIDKLVSYGVVEGRRSAGTQIAGHTWPLRLPPQPNWGSYVASGYFQANRTMVQHINHLEFDPQVVRLGTGELDPRLFPAEKMRRVLENVGRHMTSLGYPEPLGLPALRQAVSDHMASQGITAPPSSIIITSGALQALQLISASLLDGGSVVYTEETTYLQSLQVFQSAALRLCGVPMDDDGLQVQQLADMLPAGAHRVHSALYTIPTNHNPTGCTMPLARRQELLYLCSSAGLPVIEDGAYSDLTFEGTAPPALKALDTGGTVLYLGSASKALAPGLRIGWLIGPEPIVQRLGDVKMQVDYGASALSQLVMAEFLTSGIYGEYVRHLRQELRRRRDCALSVLDRHFRHLASWHVPTGGFYIWLTLQVPVDMKRLFDRAAAAGILINPGDIYGYRPTHSLRLSYAYTTPEEFKTAAVKLAAVVEKEVCYCQKKSR
ncbi:PLP-dependent aminotransferase family protein [uncultured Megasphaera sp.]|uniref:aminotransferase-like domain-containing protein n=1 Tax=uncultured Megasphaera sp. TaxID=165188 RepID=UPI00265AA5F0|nr:PLP-dependent aminotransferase family protein [uncultured Megasphaera sp.]